MKKWILPMERHKKQRDEKGKNEILSCCCQFIRRGGEEKIKSASGTIQEKQQGLVQTK